MPRFTNEWLIDASLYSYFKGVPCCGPPATPPTTVSDTVQNAVHLCPDLPTQELLQEALVSPFPDDIKDETWRDRVLFRRVVVRACMQFNEMSAATNNTMLEQLELVLKENHHNQATLIAQRQERLAKRIHKDFPSFYGTLLVHMLKQLECFSVTGLAPDGVTSEELASKKLKIHVETDSSQSPENFADENSQSERKMTPLPSLEKKQARRWSPPPSRRMFGDEAVKTKPYEVEEGRKALSRLNHKIKKKQRGKGPVVNYSKFFQKRTNKERASSKK